MSIVTEPTSPTTSALVTLARYAAVAAGTVLTTKGIVSADQLNQLIGAAVVIGPAAWGVFKSFKRSTAIKAAAPLVPDSIIQSK